MRNGFSSLAGSWEAVQQVRLYRTYSASTAGLGNNALPQFPLHLPPVLCYIPMEMTYTPQRTYTRRLAILAPHAIWLAMLLSASPLLAELSIVGPERIDLGMFDAERPQTALFTLRNTGKRTVNITRVAPTCDCLRATATPHRLAPGEQSSVVIGVLPDMLSGAFSKSVLLTTDDPGLPFMLLPVEGHARPLIAADPNRIVIAPQPDGTPVTATIKLTYRDRTFSLLPPELTHTNYLSAALIRESKKGAQIRVEAVSELPSALRHRTELLLRLDTPARPIVARYPVEIKIGPELVCIPSRVLVTPDRLQHTIYLRATGPGTPDQLRRVRYNDPDTGNQLVFLTNLFHVPAITIAMLYRGRWMVELFFKWIKQHLRIKRFFGTSSNAVKTQLWIAVSVYVLVAIIKKQLAPERNLYTLLQILSLSLFEKMPILQAFSQSEYDNQNDQSPNQFPLFDL